MEQDSFNKTIQFYDQCLTGQTEFLGIDLSDAVLDRLILSQSCNFTRASFQNASLINANMPGCCLKSASFEQANLSGANLQGADLQGADLRGAVLTGANLVDAIYDFSTQFDDGVAPSHLGMKTMAETQPQTQKSKRSPSAPHTPPASTSQPPAGSESPTVKKTKEIYYRGSTLTVEVDEAKAQQDAEAPQYKEIWYRGSRTLVEVKRADDSDHKKGISYRGATL